MLWPVSVHHFFYLPKIFRLSVPFIHSLVDANEDCLLPLAIMNNVVMDICAYPFVWTCFQFSWVYMDIYLGMQLLVHIVILFNHVRR